MRYLRFRTAGVAAAVAIAALVAMALPAAAVSGTATISAGTLAFVSAPTTIAFSATLSGADQSVSASQSFDIGDATGSGAGWNVTATSTTFTTGAPVHTLSTSAVTVASAPTVACDSGASCTVATSSVTYPYTLPAGGTAPTATKLLNAAVNTGMGKQTAPVSFSLSVPASTFAGSYSSTWTYSLVSGP